MAEQQGFDLVVIRNNVWGHECKCGFTVVVWAFFRFIPGWKGRFVLRTGTGRRSMPYNERSPLFPSSAVVAQVTVNHLVAGSNPASGALSKERSLPGRDRSFLSWLSRTRHRPGEKKITAPPSWGYFNWSSFKESRYYVMPALCLFFTTGGSCCRCLLVFDSFQSLGYLNDQYRHYDDPGEYNAHWSKFRIHVAPLASNDLSLPVVKD